VHCISLAILSRLSRYSSLAGDRLYSPNVLTDVKTLKQTKFAAGQINGGLLSVNNISYDCESNGVKPCNLHVCVSDEILWSIIFQK
jgi:hypothetical protein